MEPTPITLVEGVGDGVLTGCLISVANVRAGLPCTDDHPSAVLRQVGIDLNDGPWWASDEERTAVAMDLALDPRLCPTACDASAEAESTRRRLCVEWLATWAAPFVLDCSAGALARAGKTEDASLLRAAAESLLADPSPSNVARARQAVMRLVSHDDKAVPAWRRLMPMVLDVCAVLAFAGPSPMQRRCFEFDAVDTIDNVERVATAARRETTARDSLIDLFRRLLAVGWRQ